MLLFIIIILIIVGLGIFAYKSVCANSNTQSPAPSSQPNRDAYILEQEKAIAQNNARLAELDKQLAIVQSKIADSNKIIAEKQTELENAVRQNSTYTSNLYADRQKIVDEKIENYSRQVFDELNSKYDLQQSMLQDELDELVETYNDELECAREQLDLIKSELQEWYNKQTAINEELLRREQLEKEYEKYHIQLSDADKEDIAYLLELAKKLNKKTTLSKFVWSEYVLPAFNAMLKLQFGAKKPKSVIYMISIGDKKYIGKTKQDIGTRWTSHLKSALGIEGALTQDIHKALINNLDTASFQVLESEIPDTQLNEREKFYINQYQTDKYGYNMKAGG